MTDLSDDRALAARAMACLDLTNLNEECSSEDVRALAAKALSPRGPVAALCVWPRFAAEARRALGNAPIKVATVVIFPSGQASGAEAQDETEAAVETGADEIDMVIPYRDLMEGKSGLVPARVARVKSAAAGKTVKAILETGILRDADLIRSAARQAIEGGADFIKTSTGKLPQTATPDAARIMLEEIAAASRPVGLKPSGGIRTLDDARRYLEIADEIMGEGWATPETFRFGASGLFDALVATLEGKSVAAGSGY